MPDKSEAVTEKRRCKICAVPLGENVNCPYGAEVWRSDSREYYGLTAGQKFVTEMAALTRRILHLQADVYEMVGYQAP